MRISDWSSDVCSSDLEDLLAYLVRRLLENGANSSFVNRIQDEKLPIDEIVADPAAKLRGVARIPHPGIPLPADLFQPERKNSTGVDLNDPGSIAGLQRDIDADRKSTSLNSSH